ncbi:MAG: AMP-binding protein [Anaerolineae bacterium]|nr:AMP-binding protein [Gemmatimonadaceae bacterium]
MKGLVDIFSGENSRKAAVIVPGGSTSSYAAIQEQVECLAVDFEKGQPVAIVIGNSLEFLVTFLAVTRAGGIAAPLNPAYAEDEFHYYMKDLECRSLVTTPDSTAAISAARHLGIPVRQPIADSTARRTGDLPPPHPDDIALLLHTSGTTSRPKAVPLTHANVMASVQNIVATYALSSDDVALLVMPLFHVHGLIGVALATLASNGTLVVIPKFSAGRFWPVQHETRATWYSAVPTIHQVLLQRAEEDGAPHTSFRFIRSSSAALAPAIQHHLETRFGTPVLQAYGMTEASHQIASTPLPPGERPAGSVGRGTGLEISIGAGSEVLIRGRSVTSGYLRNPVANADAFVNGWFRTGDQGVLNDRGELTLTGRIKEIIKRGGENISPMEVDAVLLQHPAVAQAVAFAAPDSKYGEVVHAAVVLRAECDPETLRTHCRQHLADFKVPVIIHVTDQVPRTATGKIQRRHVARVFQRDES